jgi:hypothetical protein
LKLILKSLLRKLNWIPYLPSCKRNDCQREGKEHLTKGRYIDAIHFALGEPTNFNVQDHDMALFRRREDRFGSTYAPDDYLGPCSYVKYRRSLVDWMAAVGDRLSILPGTVHLAVMYVDKILSCPLRARRIPTSRYKILAAACISIAIKYDEIDGPHLPILPQLLSVTQLQQYVTPQSFGRIAERQVLQYLDYNLGAVTPWMVAHHLLENENVPTLPQDKIDESKVNMSQIHKWTAFFCGLVLQEYEFQRYRPTELAAAICLVTLVVLRQATEWRSSIIHMTGLNLHHIFPIFLHIRSYFQQRFPEYAAEINVDNFFDC